MKFEIKCRWTNQVKFVFEGEGEVTARMAVENAIQKGANLRSADLGGADLRSANLGGANLGGANLGGANLGGANLRSADLGGANLRSANLGGADLRSADLGGANLRSADLGGANLRSADLGGADLRSANLGGANLRSADLEPIRDDFWAVLSAAPQEVSGLRKALVEGRVDGSTYEGECACVVGTIANVAGKDYQSLPVLKPNSSRPIERFFIGIQEGDTPESSQFSKLALEWLDDWTSRMTSAFGGK